MPAQETQLQLSMWTLKSQRQPIAPFYVFPGLRDYVECLPITKVFRAFKEHRRLMMITYELLLPWFPLHREHMVQLRRICTAELCGGLQQLGQRPHAKVRARENARVPCETTTLAALCLAFACLTASYGWPHSLLLTPTI